MALTKVSYSDNEKLELGTGNDLEIYHDANHSYIAEVGTGSLKLKGDDIRLENASGNNVFKLNSSVAELSHNGSTKLVTSATGVDVTGQLVTDGASHAGDVIFQGDGANTYWDKSADDLIFNDNAKAAFGTDSDFTIHHNGSNSKIDNTTGTLYIQGDVVSLAGAGGSENLAVFTKNGSCDLYYDNTRVVTTQPDGIAILGAEGGSGVIYLYADEGDDNDDKWKIEVDTSGNFTVNNLTSGSWEKSILCNGENSTDLYYDNSTKFQTTSGGVKAYGDVALTSADGHKAIFGAGSDLEIYHNGTSSFIDTATDHDLYIRNTQGNQIRLQPRSGEDGVRIIADAAVELYHNNSKKLETNAGGILIDHTNNGYGGLKITDSTGGDYSVRYYAGRNQVGTAHVFYTGGRTQNTTPWADETGLEVARISGNGIAFNGDTSADNGLDDYEQGSWTPNDASGQSLTITASNSTYTKIGDTVIARCKLTMPNTSNSSTIKVGGLPYTVGTLDGGCGQGIHDDSQTYGWLAIAGTTYLQAYAAASLSASTWNQVSTSEVYGLTCIYKVA